MKIKLDTRTIDTNDDFRIFNLKEFDFIVNKVLDARLKPKSKEYIFLKLNNILMAELGLETPEKDVLKYKKASKKLMGYIDKEVGTNFLFYSD